MQTLNCPSVTLQSACFRLVASHKTLVSKYAWAAFMSRGISVQGVAERWQLEACFCQMDFLNPDCKPDWPKICKGMPFWARQLLAVSISMMKLQMLIDDDCSSFATKAIQDQLNMWRV